MVCGDGIQIVNIKLHMNFIGKVCLLSDLNKKRLGFMPKGAMQDYANKGNIIIAINGDKLAGYLLYREAKKYNKISITHVCVDDLYRGQHISDNLVAELKNISINTNGIFLYCRKDYKVNLWRRCGFTVRHDKPGRSKQGSVLEYWWFSNQRTSLQQDLWSMPTEKECVVLDANTLFDMESEEIEAEESKALLGDWLQEIELCVTPEVYNEIDRKNNDTEKKFWRKYASNYRDITADYSNVKIIKKELDKLVNSSTKGSFESDKYQIAWSISGKADYFATRDSKLLNYSKEIEEFYGLSIVRPSSLIMKLDSILNESSYKPYKLINSSVKKIKYNGDYNKFIEEKFLCYEHGEKKHDFNRKISRRVIDLKNTEIIVVETNNNPSIFYMLHKGKDNYQYLELIRIIKDNISVTITHKIISNIVHCGVSEGYHSTIVNDDYIPDSVVDVLIEYGFYKTSNGWRKNHTTGLVYRKNLDENELMRKLFGDKWDSITTLPDYHIEKYLWPSKVISETIENYIIPIEAYWAKELFDEEYSSCDLFGADTFLIMNNENIYYRSARPAIVTDKSRVLWYVKNSKLHQSSGAIRAISMLDYVDVGKPKDLFRKYNRYGVYKWNHIYTLAKNNIDNEIMAIKFKNTENFKVCIPFNDVNDILKSHGQNKNQFQSPVKIDQKSFEEIYFKSQTTDN